MDNSKVISNKEVIDKHAAEILAQPNSKTNAEIARQLISTYGYTGIKLDSLRRAVSTFLVSNKQVDDILYNYNETVDNDVEVTTANEELDEKVISKSLALNYEFNDDFSYDESKDVYYFYFENKPLKFTGTIIRDMKEKYSNMVSPSLTINEICKTFGVPRGIFVRIKTTLGWTHDDDPYTNEELAKKDIDELSEDLLQRKKFQLFQTYNRKDEQQTKEAAQKWWSLIGNKLNPFLEKMETINSTYVVPKLKLSNSTNEDDVVCVISPFDLHYGKYAWDGETNDNYDRSIARERLFVKTTQILNDATKYNISKFIVAVGSDFFHIDNFNNSTTKGTKQDIDGTITQIMAEGNQIMVEFIDLLRQIAHVELLLAAGNHDNLLSIMLQQYLSAYYRNTDDVTVNNKFTDRQYTSFGKTLIGFTHGDGTKLDKLPNLMANEESELWGKTKHRVFFVGHLHSEVIKDVEGVKIYQMPSLSGTDKWHHKNGYVNAVKGMSAYIIDSDNGVRASLIANV